MHPCRSPDAFASLPVHQYGPHHVKNKVNLRRILSTYTLACEILHSAFICQCICRVLLSTTNSALFSHAE